MIIENQNMVKKAKLSYMDQGSLNVYIKTGNI